MFRLHQIGKFRPHVIFELSGNSTVQLSSPRRFCCVLLKSHDVLPAAGWRSFFCRQTSHVLTQTLSRNFSTTSTRYVEEGKLVYTGNLALAVRGVKTFSYCSSGFSLLMLPHIFLKTGLGLQSVALQVAFCGFIGFFTFLTPIMLHLMTKGYVFRLYHHQDTDTYTAVTLSALLREKKTVFHQQQVEIPGVSKMFTTFYANKMGLLVNPYLFPYPQDYNHLMGYDQPFNFDTDPSDKPSDS